MRGAAARHPRPRSRLIARKVSVNSAGLSIFADTLPPQVAADDGIFYMSKEEFFKYFATVYLCACDMQEFIRGDHHADGEHEGCDHDDGEPDCEWVIKVCHRTGLEYYANRRSQETTMDRPAELAAALPAGWVQKLDKVAGKAYYVNLATSETTFRRPRAPAQP